MLTLSDVIVPTFVGGLNGLRSFVGKAEAFADANGLAAAELLEAQLRGDMFNFTRQIQSAADAARRGADRLAGVEPSSVPDTETSFAELDQRLIATQEHVRSIDTAAIDAILDTSFTVNFGPMSMEFTGRRYALDFAIPNFMFHVVTAYDILRHKGVELGKREFLSPFVTG